MCTDKSDRYKELTERISYFKASEEPLSSDIGIIKGDKCTYIYDVGADDESLQFIRSIKGEKRVIISHFHPDHSANLLRLDLTDEELLVSEHSFKYTHFGTVLRDDVLIEDGVKLRIFDLPSSHAKGSLGLEVDGKYAFLGDGVYDTVKKGKNVYNVQKLRALIDKLESLDAEFLLLSHKPVLKYKKIIIIAFLNRIYNKRNTSEAYVES